MRIKNWEIQPKQYLRGKVLVLYLASSDKKVSNNLSIPLNENSFQKEEQNKHQWNRKQVIIKAQTQFNQTF